MILKDHPDRSRVLAELHARPFAAASTPLSVRHFAFQVSAVEAEEDTARIERLANGGTHDGGWLADKRHVSLDGGGLRWERHGEFISYTICNSQDLPPAWPPNLIPPGRLLVAINLNLISDAIRQNSMVEATIVDGKAVISTDFSPNPDGFVEIWIVNRGMTDEIAGATIQRVLEIETYRCLALLGLPAAERAARALGAIENELPSLMEKIGTASSLEDNRALLDRLTLLSLELEKSSASTHFRFGATRAYAELVRLRLEALAEHSEFAERGLGSFLSRRFNPAIRTCATVADREAILARKLTQAAQLLRTRVEIALESQNRDLLEAMGERLQLQLRLQQTVEGLSVAAIAYYVASLFHLVVLGFSPIRYLGGSDVLTALAVIPIVVIVAATIRRIRQGHLRSDGVESAERAPTPQASLRG